MPIMLLSTGKTNYVVSDKNRGAPTVEIVSHGGDNFKVQQKLIPGKTKVEVLFEKKKKMCATTATILSFKLDLQENQITCGLFAKIRWKNGTEDTIPVESINKILKKSRTILQVKPKIKAEGRYKS